MNWQERAEKAEDVLRSLASFVGAGGYNADKVDADVFEQKIRWGIGQIMERLEKAEAELKAAREQEPVAWCDPVEFAEDPWSFQGFRQRSSTKYPTMPLYTRPIPAPAPAAPAVPEEWREMMAELADDLAIEIDQNYPPERRAYPSEQRKYEREMVIVNRARALLQSAPTGEPK